MSDVREAALIMWQRKLQESLRDTEIARREIERLESAMGLMPRCHLCGRRECGH